MSVLTIADANPIQCTNTPLGDISEVQKVNLMATKEVNGYLNVKFIFDPLFNIDQQKDRFNIFKKTMNEPFVPKNTLNDEKELIATKGKSSQIFDKCWEIKALPVVVTKPSEKLKLLTFMNQNQIEKTYLALHSHGQVMLSYSNEYYDDLNLNATQFNARWPTLKKEGGLEITNDDNEGDIVCMRTIQSYFSDQQEFMVARYLVNSIPIQPIFSKITQLKLIFTQLDALEEIEENKKAFTFILFSLEALDSLISKASWEYKDLIMMKELCMEINEMLVINSDNTISLPLNSKFIEYLGVADVLSKRILVQPVGRVGNYDKIKFRGNVSTIDQILTISKFQGALNYKENSLIMDGYLMSSSSNSFKPLFMIDQPLPIACQDHDKTIPSCSEISMQLKPYAAPCARDLLDSASATHACPLNKVVPDFTISRNPCSQEMVKVSTTHELELDLRCNQEFSQTLFIPKGLHKLYTQCAVFMDKNPVLVQHVKDAMFKKIDDFAKKHSGKGFDYNVLYYSAIGVSTFMMVMMCFIISYCCMKCKNMPPITRAESQMSMSSSMRPVPIENPNNN